MGEVIDLNPITRLTAGAVGKPGQRVFYLQGESTERRVTLLCEKQQVQSLGGAIEKFLQEIQEKNPHLLTPSGSYFEPDMELIEPLEPLFRVGEIALGYDEDTDLVVIIAQESVEDESQSENASVVRFWATRSQSLAMAQWGVNTAAKGRPICGNCLQPIDPDGHFCPRRNGHKY